jgi:membrane protease YdiL (CAAX protease family)
LSVLETERQERVQCRGARMQTFIRIRVIRGYDLNLIAVVGISTLALVLERYCYLDIDFPRANELIYYLLIPLMAGWLLFRDRPWDYGIRIGRWKQGIIAVAIGLAIMAPILYGVSRMADFRSHYGRYAADWPALLLDTTLYMFAWEFIFRGYMTFGLERSIGISAIFVQAIPFVLLHTGIGKPFLETLATIPGGFALGYVAYRARSFLPCFIIHFGIYVMLILCTSI